MVPLQNRPRRSTRPSLNRMPGMMLSGRSNAFWRIQDPYRRVCPVILIQFPTLNVGPPQEPSARVPQDALADDIAGAENVDRLHCSHDGGDQSREYQAENSCRQHGHEVRVGLVWT